MLALILVVFHAVLVLIGQGVYSFYLFLRVTVVVLPVFAVVICAHLLHITSKRSENSAVSFWRTLVLVRYELLLNVLSYVAISLVTVHDFHQIYWKF